MIYNSPEELLSEIQRQMILRHISMSDLANKMGTSRANISRLFSVANPQLSSLFKICEALDLNFDCNFTHKNSDEI